MTDLPERDPWAVFKTVAWEPGASSALEDAAATWLETQAKFPFIREVGRRSLDRLALAAGETVLDVGCGVGVLLPALAERIGSGGHVVGLDHNPRFLGRARQRMVDAGLADRLTLVEGDALSLPFPDRFFDAAHCERVLMHLDDPDQVIREMVRVVRPGGRVVAAEVFAASAAIDMGDPATASRLTEELVSGIRNPGMGIELRRRFIDAGLIEVDGEVVTYFETELDDDELEEIEAASRRLIAAGSIEPTRAAAAVAAARDHSATGRHCGLSLIFVVSGRVRGDAPD